MTAKTFTPLQLWKDFDDNLENPSINFVSYTTCDNYTKIKLFYNALHADNGDVRVYVELLFPTGHTHCPTLLFIQDTKPYDTEYEMGVLAGRGFCVATFDYVGDASRLHTTYPSSLAYGKLSDAGDHLDTAYHGANNTSPYLWSQITRKTISLLSSLPYVDATKIAIIAANFGTNMLMQVASMDARVKGAVSIFNNCSNKQNCINTADEVERNRWEIGCALQSYAKFMRCKFLMALATNNVSYNFFDTHETITLLPEPTNCWVAASIGSDNCLKAGIADTIGNWLQETLSDSPMCAMPTLHLQNNGDGELRLAINADASYNTITEAFVSLSYGDNSAKHRKWKTQPVSIGLDGKGQTIIQSYNDADAIYAFVNVYYRNGSVYTSQMFKVTPLELVGIAHYSRNDRIIYDKKMGVSPFNTECNKMFAPHNNISFELGTQNISGISIKRGDLSTYNISDMTNVDDDTLIQFDCYSAKKRAFDVVLTDCDGNEYSHTVCLENDSEWSKIIIGLNEFKNASMVQLKQWNTIKKLIFRKAEGLLFNNILWI